jgi:hypothetical protein
MAELNINSQDEKPKVSKLAILSMALGGVGLCLSCLMFLLFLLEISGLYSFVIPYRLDELAAYIWGLSSLGALLIGAVALIRILFSKRKKTGCALAILGMLAAIASLYCLCLLVGLAKERDRKYMQGQLGRMTKATSDQHSPAAI